MKTSHTLYGDFQTRMERYWSLRWIMQESVGQIEAIVVKGDLVGIDGLPFMQRVPGLPEDLPRGRQGPVADHGVRPRGPRHGFQASACS